MPLSQKQKKLASGNNICSCCISFSITSPACVFVFFKNCIQITNFHDFQIIHTCNESVNQSNTNLNIKAIIGSIPKNPSFSLERIHWRLSCKASYKNSPSTCGKRRASVQSSLIPQTIWSCTSCCISTSCALSWVSFFS